MAKELLPALPGKGQSVLDYAAEADLRHRLAMIKFTAVALIKTERGLSRPKRQQLLAELDRELGELGI